jgi:hypothetical protein
MFLCCYGAKLSDLKLIIQRKTFLGYLLLDIARDGTKDHKFNLLPGQTSETWAEFSNLALAAFI